MFRVNRNPRAKDLRRFGWAMLAGFTVVGAVAWLAGRPEGRSPLSWRGSPGQLTGVAFLGVGLAVWLVSTLSPRAARTVYVAWMTAASHVGRVMSLVLLTALFVGLLPLFSLIVRMGDPMRRRRSSTGTYWEPYRAH